MYRIMTDEEKKERHIYDGYDGLIGPNFECVLTEPEDRTWHRDGGEVLDELNRQHDLLQRALKIISDAIMHGMPITEEVAAVRNEILGVRQ